MAKCKQHNWEWLMPESNEVAKDKAIEYALETNILGMNLSAILYCPVCKKTGTYIKSRKGGVRVHTTNIFIEKAKKLRVKYNLPGL